MINISEKDTIPLDYFILWFMIELPEVKIPSLRFWGITFFFCKAGIKIDWGELGIITEKDCVNEIMDIFNK